MCKAHQQEKQFNFPLIVSILTFFFSAANHNVSALGAKKFSFSESVNDVMKDGSYFWAPGTRSITRCQCSDLSKNSLDLQSY